MTAAPPHCCDDMREQTESQELYLMYEPKFREYGIGFAHGGPHWRSIRFCPWCGHELPPSLRDAWLDELERRGMAPQDKLPTELRDDSWWRALHA